MLDPAIMDRTISEALQWIGRAQDNAPSADGGVARHYCLITGWGASYPETTGYIVPTIIREGQASGDTELLRPGPKNAGLAGQHTDAGRRLSEVV